MLLVFACCILGFFSSTSSVDPSHNKVFKDGFLLVCSSSQRSKKLPFKVFVYTVQYFIKTFFSFSERWPSQFLGSERNYSVSCEADALQVIVVLHHELPPNYSTFNAQPVFMQKRQLVFF